MGPRDKNVEDKKINSGAQKERAMEPLGMQNYHNSKAFKQVKQRPTTWNKELVSVNH